MNNTLVFVYGSLKRGFYNHNILRQSKFHGDHCTEARYTMISLGDYPAVIKKGNTAIHGEVYAVDQHTFQQLDILEDYPDMYTRIQINTRFGNAWMYVMNENHDGHLIESGIWK